MPWLAGLPREMIGIGAANIAAGLFQGFPASTSGSRTAVAEQAGAKTQVTGLVGAAAITLILLLAPGMFHNLPQPTLAAVVIAASASLADVRGTARLLHDRPTEFALSVAALAGVVGLGVLPGIGVAVALSIGTSFAEHGGRIRRSSVGCRESPAITTFGATRSPNSFPVV